MSTSLKDKRLGETQMQNCGMEAKITDYQNANNITVEFSDGTKVASRTYACFQKGAIGHPNRKHNQHLKATNHIDEIHMQHCGMEAKIIDYQSTRNITVEFSDGTKVTDRTYAAFVRGQIKHPDMRRNQQLLESGRLGETYIQNCGMDATIIRYQNANNIDIVFQDGTIVENREYRNFINGAIGHPEIYHKFVNRKLYEHSHSKIYHTKIFGIAHYTKNGDACYYSHCPICQTHAIWTFNTIKNHECNQKLAQERDELIQELKEEANDAAPLPFNSTFNQNANLS